MVRDHGEDTVDGDGLCLDIVDAAYATTPSDMCLITWQKPWEFPRWKVSEHL